MASFKRKNLESKYKEIPWEDEQIREGGNSTVKKMQDSAGNFFAVKCLKSGFIKNAKDSEKISRFLQEIDLIKRFSPSIEGILPITDCDIGEFWYAMPIAYPVMGWIKEKNFSIEDIIKHFIPLINTLEQLHNNHIAHRDIKPENIFFYNNRFFFGDFGIARDLTKNNGWTKDDKAMGATFTVAPEMQRHPTTADPLLGDIYSLGKTLWMLIMHDSLGFDGQYDYLSDKCRMNQKKELEEEYLVEIEKILKQATNPIPEQRPSLQVFKKYLENWFEQKNSGNTDENEWKFLLECCFGENAPTSCSWENIDCIVNILNIISKRPATNHVFLPSGGGLDLRSAKKASEEGCVYLKLDYFTNLIRPKRLYLESFSNAIFNYFLLELENVEPIEGIHVYNSWQKVVEDYPAHYVSGKYAIYKVYDYDSGKPLPDGFKTLRRWLRGKFLIVSKSSPYNDASSTYDGRHNDCTAQEFHHYMSIILGMSKNESRISASTLLNINPWKKAETNFEKGFAHKDISSLVFKSISSLNFSKYLPKVKKHFGRMKFYFKLYVDSGLGTTISFSPTKPSIKSDSFDGLLLLNGNVQNSTNLKQAFFTTSRKDAVKVKKILNNAIFDLLGLKDDGSYIKREYFTIKIEWKKQPLRIFSQNDFLPKLKQADDRKRNTIVLDEYGNILVEPDCESTESYPAIVMNIDGWNNNVGKYAAYPDDFLNELYKSSLSALNHSLINNESAHYDDSSLYKKEEELLDDLKKSLSKYPGCLSHLMQVKNLCMNVIKFFKSNNEN